MFGLLKMRMGNLRPLILAHCSKQSEIRILSFLKSLGSTMAPLSLDTKSTHRGFADGTPVIGMTLEIFQQITKNISVDNPLFSSKWTRNDRDHVFGWCSGGRHNATKEFFNIPAESDKIADFLTSGTCKFLTGSKPNIFEWLREKGLDSIGILYGFLALTLLVILVVVKSTDVASSDVDLYHHHRRQRESVDTQGDSVRQQRESADQFFDQGLRVDGASEAEKPASGKLSLDLDYLKLAGVDRSIWSELRRLWPFTQRDTEDQWEDIGLPTSSRKMWHRRPRHGSLRYMGLPDHAGRPWNINAEEDWIARMENRGIGSGGRPSLES